jgi:predicted NBD/HSP70 family sugar kinase
MYGPRCSCGQRGCWEAYISKRAMIARYLGKDPSWPESAQLTGVTVEEIIERARTGDRRGMQTLQETGRYLGRGFATIIKAIDPKRIYVGGEITAAWDFIGATVRDTLREDALLRDAGETEILIVGLGEHARLRGAAALVNTPAFAAPVLS